MYKNIILTILVSILSGCLSNTNKLSISKESERPKAKAYCNSIYAGLESISNAAYAKGKITFVRKGITVSDEIEYFGKENEKHKYYISGPKVPNLINTFYCKNAPLYKIKSIIKPPSNKGYLITLKNNKTYSTRSSWFIQMYDKKGDFHYYNALAEIEGNESTWLWYSKESSNNKLAEIKLAPSAISKLEIY